MEELLDSNLRNDSRTLGRVFSNIGNPNTGVGTSRDRTTGVEINATPWLTQQEIAQLAQVGVIRKIISEYPKRASAAWYEYKPTTKKNNLHLIHQYYRDLSEKSGGINLKEAMRDASVLGREAGDGFILVGFADNKALSEPLDMNQIYSVEWLRVLSRWELAPVYSGNPSRPSMYQLRLLNDELPDGSQHYNKLIHPSRVRRFPGIKLTNTELRHRQGYNLSIVESLVNSFMRREMALANSNLMIDSHQLRTLGLKGLGDLIREDVQRKSSANSEALMQRLLTLDMGASAAKTLLYDMDEESIENLNITYGGVNEIIDKIQDAFVADCDLPRDIVLNEIGGRGNLLSGDSYRVSQLNMAKLTQRWQFDNWESHLLWFSKVAIAARDCKAKMPADGIELVFGLDYEDDPVQTAATAKSHAEKSKILIESKVFTPEEVRASYSHTGFDPTLNPS
jgi:hypothetical protein